MAAEEPLRASPEALRGVQGKACSGMTARGGSVDNALPSHGGRCHRASTGPPTHARIRPRPCGYTTRMLEHTPTYTAKLHCTDETIARARQGSVVAQMRAPGTLTGRRCLLVTHSHVTRSLACPPWYFRPYKYST